MASTNILQILSEHGGSMKRSQLITYLRGFNITLINRKLEELAMDGSIKISGNTVILVPTYRADQMLRKGLIQEDGSTRPTGHKQVAILYKKTLFQVRSRSNKLLPKIIVDEGMVDLLRAVWRHGISTTKSCQGGNGETAWIGFQSVENVVRFHNLIGHISKISGKKEWIFGKESLEISFPSEHIAMMTEELNSKPID